LIGDPGIGKTAIVEGLAWRLAHKKDPALEQDWDRNRNWH
jgi:ATP-dependent Clp protease ATP-binding subunit ClpA